MKSKKWQQINSNDKSIRSSKKMKLFIVIFVLLTLIFFLSTWFYINVINSGKQKIITDSTNQLIAALFEDKPVGFSGTIYVKPTKDNINSVEMSYSGISETGIAVSGNNSTDAELIVNFSNSSAKIYPKILNQDGKTYIKFDDIKFSLNQLSTFNSNKFSADGIDSISKELNYLNGRWVEVTNLRPQVLTSECRAAISSSQKELSKKMMNKKIIDSGLIDEFEQLDNKRVDGKESFHFRFNVNKYTPDLVISLLPEALAKQCSGDSVKFFKGISSLELWVDKTNHKMNKVVINYKDSGVDSIFTLRFRNQNQYQKVKDVNSVGVDSIKKSIEDLIGIKL